MSGATAGQRRRPETRDSKIWYRTDNAGRIFSSLVRWRVASVFRVSATLKSPVRVAALQQAVSRTMRRFPYFAVQLRPGFFWYYFEPSDKTPQVQADSKFPCNDLQFRRSGAFPFRIRAYHKRIAVEMAHVLTDGTGALAFLRTLVIEYLDLAGEVGRKQEWIPEEDPEEAEDAFSRYYRPGLPPPPKMGRAFLLPYEEERKRVRHLTTGTVSAAALKCLARERKVSIGEFLIALYLDTLQDAFFGLDRTRQRIFGRPIRLDVPVNLRPLLPSRTMRNFFLQVFPEIDPRLGRYSFEEILHQVHHFMRSEVNAKPLMRLLGRNVGAERNFWIRTLPLFVKNTAIPSIYARWNLTKATSGLSNLGLVTLPEPCEPFVDRFDFVTTHPSSRGVAVGVVTYGDRLSICFHRLLVESTVERLFFRKLVGMGLKVRIESNQP
jgi:hypothetical protein